MNTSVGRQPIGPWKREQNASHAMAWRRGCTVDELTQRGSLADDSVDKS
jgi:hypothetical protein